MGLFKKKTQEKEIKNLMLLRYTYDVFQILFPKSNRDAYENRYFPDDASAFIKSAVSSYKKIYGGKCKILSVTIATIDDAYIVWLKKHNYNHSIKRLFEYTDEYENDIEYWDEHYKASGMTTSYHVLCIPCTMMLPNATITEYSLDSDCCEQIQNILSENYHESNVYLPGWYVHANEMPKCAKRIVSLSKEYFETGMRIRLGQYLEQSYHREKEIGASYLYMSVPFVIKTENTNSKIDFRKSNQQDENQSFFFDMINFTEKNKINLMSGISKFIPNIISIEQRAMSPGEVYVKYQLFDYEIQLKNNQFAY